MVKTEHDDENDRVHLRIKLKSCQLNQTHDRWRDRMMLEELIVVGMK